MTAQDSIFLDFNLPNATTWFYFSWLLAMALFFKFSRLLSVRNWDVITLFLLVPGLLLLQQARPETQAQRKHTAVEAATLVGAVGGQALAGPVAGLGGVAATAGLSTPPAPLGRLQWFGYLWLLCGSVYFLVRCLTDLVLVRRPALAPNLTFGGLAWLAAALFICLSAVAFRQPVDGRSAEAQAAAPPAAPVKGELTGGRQCAPLDLAQEQVRQRVHDADAQLWLWPAFAVLCHLSVVAGLVVIGRRHFQDAAAGMAAATFYLMLPYTGQFVGNFQHVWPMAVMVWAVAAYRKPTLAGLLLGLASSVVFFPALVLPVWLSFYRGRGLGRFLGAFALSAGLCLAVIGTTLWLTGTLDSTLRETLALPSWQPWQEVSAAKVQGFWTGVHWAYRMPLFIAYLAFLVGTAFWPAPKDLAHVIALSAAVLIGLQLWYADQGGVYVLWYLPFLLLLVFRPNLADRRPAPINAETDWLTRGRHGLVCVSAWLLRIPDPVARVR
jgi:hypothetical protein